MKLPAIDADFGNKRYLVRLNIYI